MARLVRLRIVNLGHQKARMDDISLDFDGKDSVVWLRNGGGKSSILNLFYALVQPKRTQFLGATSEQKGRQLEDYVHRSQPGAVIAEWELDAPPSLIPDAQPRRHLTGVFYEYREQPRLGAGGAERADKLMRMFFAARVRTDVSQLTLEGVPLAVTLADGVSRRRNRQSFLTEWTALRATYPDAEVMATETQSEWLALLDHLGLDPELFGYQLKMNAQEGGAAQLFAYTDMTKFVNFLMELILDPAATERVARNIETYQSEMRRRVTELLPLRDLLAGVEARLGGVRVAATKRSALVERLTQVQAQAVGLRDALDARMAERAAQAVQAAADQREAEEAVQAATQQALAARQRSAQVRRWAAEERLREATEAAEVVQRAHTAAQRTARLWDLVLPLRSYRRAKTQVEEREAQLKRLAVEHAPVREQAESHGGRFVAALLARATHHRTEAQRIEEHRNALRAQAAQAREAMRQVDREAGAADMEAKGHQATAQQARRELEALVVAGALTRGEAPRAAYSRWTTTLRQLEEARGATEQRLAEAEAGLEASREAIRVAGTRHVEARAARDAVHQQLQSAERALAAVTTNRLLSEILEVEKAEVRHLTVAAVGDLRAAAREAVDRIVRLRLSRAVDERAARALEETQLLPPSLDVERVLAVASTVAPRAWSGWDYLSRAVSVAQARALVHRAPAMATGIVVPDGDYERVCEALERFEPQVLDAPVLVSPESAVQAALAPTSAEAAHAAVGRIFGPTDPAVVDRSAATSALRARRAALAQTETALTKAEERRHACDELAAHLESFLERYPAGWFDQQRSRLTTAAAEQKAAEDAEAVAVEQARIAEATLRERQTALDTLEREAAAAERSVGRIDTFLRAHPEGVEGHERRAAEAKARAAERHGEARRLDDEAKTAEREREALEDPMLERRNDADSTEREVQRVRYRPSGAIVPEAGDVSALRHSYDQYAAEYEKRVDQSALIALRDRAAEDMAEAEKEMQRTRTGVGRDITVEEAAALLDALGDPGEAEDRRRAAQDETERAAQALRGPREERGRAEGELASAVKELGQAGAIWPLLDVPPSVEAGLTEAEEQAVRAAALAQDAHDAKQVAEEYELAARSARTEVKELDGWRERADGALRNHELLLQLRVRAPRASATPDRLDAAAVTATLKRLEEEFRDAVRAEEAITRERDAVVRNVTAWLNDDRFQHLRLALVAQLRQWEPVQFESDLDMLGAEIALETAQVTAQIESLDKHRTVLVDMLKGVALDGVRRLRLLESQSVIPQGVPTLEGRHFVKVRHHLPQDPVEQSARLAAFLDRTVAESRLPGALELIQQAVHEVAGKITIEVLFPDPDERPEHHPVTHLASKFSGGEGLTGATILYCTLARVRAYLRGVAVQSAGVLLADNPTGKASRAKFLALQRAVAEHMGVQLCYFTGVNDFEALRVFPNIIRLKNDKRDRRTRERLLELDRSQPAAGAPTGVVPLGRVEGVHVSTTSPVVPELVSLNGTSAPSTVPAGVVAQ